MKLIWWLFLIIFIIFLISCSKESTTTSLVVAPVQENFVKNISIEETTIEDPCKKINCDENRTCSNGKCVCKMGMKECNNNCINSSLCCKDADCKEQQLCVEGICNSKKECNYLEVLNPITNKCVCDITAKFCPNQNKCIPRSNCCNNFNCNIYYDNICTETKSRIKLCISGNTSTICKHIILGQSEVIELLGKYFEVYLNKIYDDKKIDLLIEENNNQANITELNINKEEITSVAKIKYINVSTYGGKCVSS